MKYEKAIYYIYFPQDVLLLFVKYIAFIFAITFTINPYTEWNMSIWQIWPYNNFCFI